MATFLHNSPSLHRALFSNASSYQSPALFNGFQPRAASLQVKAETSSSLQEDVTNRRCALVLGVVGTCILLSSTNSKAFAIEAKKGFQAVLDKKDGYVFLYPFGWQEVSIQGQDKVFKDVIEPLESVSVNLIETNKQDIRELGSPKEVAEALIKKVLAPPSQKTKLIDASEHEVDGKVYYSFEFIAKAPNFTRHALGTVCIGNGKFYTLTTGSNERRWEKMKDKLHAVIDSFKLSTV